MKVSANYKQSKTVIIDNQHGVMYRISNLVLVLLFQDNGLIKIITPILWLACEVMK